MHDRSHSRIASRAEIIQYFFSNSDNILFVPLTRAYIIMLMLHDQLCDSMLSRIVLDCAVFYVPSNTV